MSAPDPLMTSRELAEYLGVSRDWVLNHWQRDEIPGFRLSGSRGPGLRFRRSEIEAWLESRRGGPLPSEAPYLRAVEG